MSFFSFTKLEYRKAEQVLPGGMGEGCEGSVKEGEYSTNTVYTCMLMEK
jgi:hypothetical protein